MNYAKIQYFSGKIDFKCSNDSCRRDKVRHLFAVHKERGRWICYIFYSPYQCYDVPNTACYIQWKIEGGTFRVF